MDVECTRRENTRKDIFVLAFVSDMLCIPYSRAASVLPIHNIIIVVILFDICPKVVCIPIT